jgi:hypothetical protein
LNLFPFLTDVITAGFVQYFFCINKSSGQLSITAAYNSSLSEPVFHITAYLSFLIDVVTDGCR